jgi:EAL domain-containing protein (putative c-di-GMP-specific phosphodiesterase class I)
MAIAEGVEEESQRTLLKEMGCDLIQGYWLSRPLPADQLDAFLVDACAERSCLCRN